MDWQGALAITTSFAMVGFLTWIITRQGAAGVLDPNSVVGIRTKATMVSAATWQAGHAAAIRPALLTTTASVAASSCGVLVLAFFSDSSATIVGTVAVLAAIAIMIGGLTLTAAAANKAAARHRPGD